MPTPTPTLTAQSGPATAARTVEPTPIQSHYTPMLSPDYGMQVFLFWRQETADRDLQLVKAAGFRWVKQEFAWREIEGAGRGIFDWTNTDRVMDQIDE